MLTSCAITALCAQNFEHLTQAATGATTGDWLVKFCKSSVSRCSRVESTWSKLSAQLAASRDAKGMVRVNVASVDTTDSGWLTKCFGMLKGAPLGSARARLLRLLLTHLAALGGGPLPPGGPGPLGAQSLPLGCSSQPHSPSRRFRHLVAMQALRHHLGACGAAL